MESLLKKAEGRVHPTLVDNFRKVVEAGIFEITPERAKKTFEFMKSERVAKFLSIGITNRCQLTCEHCLMASYSNSAKEELTTEEIKRLIDKSGNLTSIQFFGGEPTLRPDLIELIKYASERTIFVILDTNGLLITKEYAERLKDNGLEFLFTSIDSPNPEVHDKGRGAKGCFEKTVAAIKNSVNAGLKCVISTYLSRDILKNGDFEKIIELAKEWKVTAVRYVLPTPVGKLLHRMDLALTPEEFAYLRNMVKDRYPFIFRDLFTQFQDSSRCANYFQNTADMIFISAHGEIQSCFAVPLSFGNIHEEPYEDILERMYNHEMFKEDWASKECPMLSKEFREKYIDTIPKDAPLPYRIK